MKVFERNLVIGDEYLLNGTSSIKVVFVGYFNGDVFFYPIDKEHQYNIQEDGTIRFVGIIPDVQYEEA